MRLAWAPGATDDLHRIWMFVAERDVALADRIEQRINAGAELLRHLPLLGRATRMAGERDFSLVDVQYVLRYAVAEDRIVILRVFHTRQDRERR